MFYTRDILRLVAFCIWDMLQLGHYEAWDVLRLGLFYIWGILKFFVCSWDFMSWESWIWNVLRQGRFFLGRFVPRPQVLFWPLNLPTWFTVKRVKRVFSPIARFAELVNFWRMRRLGATPSPSSPPHIPRDGDSKEISKRGLVSMPENTGC
jgi:hypothetical protein